MGILGSIIHPTAVRASIIAGLSTNGGDVDAAVNNAILGEADGEPSAPEHAGADQMDGMSVRPKGETGAEGGRSTQAEGAGSAGQATAGFKSENTPAGEQTLIPGTKTEQTGDAQRARAEMAARQQHSKILWGDQTRVETTWTACLPNRKAICLTTATTRPPSA